MFFFGQSQKAGLFEWNIPDCSLQLSGKCYIICHHEYISLLYIIISLHTGLNICFKLPSIWLDVFSEPQMVASGNETNLSMRRSALLCLVSVHLVGSVQLLWFSSVLLHFLGCLMVHKALVFEAVRRPLSLRELESRGETPPEFSTGYRRFHFGIARFIRWWISMLQTFFSYFHSFTFAFFSQKWHQQPLNSWLFTIFLNMNYT